MFSLLVTLPFSNCLGIPVLTVGIRRYTTNENRGFAFGLFYVVMNIGALIAGPFFFFVSLKLGSFIPSQITRRLLKWCAPPQRYCPEHVEEGKVRHSKTMWMIIGLSTIVSPIMITILWGYISGSGDEATKASISSGRNEVVTEDTNSLIDSYQHKPLTHQISLPKVRSQECIHCCDHVRD